MAPPKEKPQKMSYNDFMVDPSFGSWADEMEDMPVNHSRTGYGSDRRTYKAPNSYGNDRYNSDRGGRYDGGRAPVPLPTKPPFTARLGNLSYDITESNLVDLFSSCQLSTIRIVEDRLDNKPKGYGYAEFQTLDGLKSALAMDNTSLQGRYIRVNVADPPKDHVEPRELNDWTRKGPLPDLPPPFRRNDRPGYGNFDNNTDIGSERDGGRRMNESSDGKFRDFNNWERKGPLPDLPVNHAAGRDGSVSRNGVGLAGMGNRFKPDNMNDRRNLSNWGEKRSQEGSRPPRTEHRDRNNYERPPLAPELDSCWRSKMRPDPPPVEPSATAISTPAPELAEKNGVETPPIPPAPAVRPKLNLAPRTIKDDDKSNIYEPTPETMNGKSNPFGQARPIDTFAREKEIEERRAAPAVSAAPN